MSEPNPSLLSHISVGSNDFERATAFYDAVMPTLGARRIEAFPGAVAYGKAFPEFWVQTPLDGARASIGNGTHFGFIAESPQAVDAFHAAALAAGGSDEGAPGPRPQYGAAYYGGYVRDPDGHKIEAAFWDEALAGAT
ncbi:VOC family protein [Pseudoxanthomonas wuyuanensis]|uniref:Catechol 2,3-dioxygenase n=1 Tax=Pseudoxanthomonas wuyuanensis TaxID=1073196 RepID=A0A286D9W5_9GAMM|nr:VOC family protein [Pseudoxanthomonas wuyuanensis]KAF1719458.1 VOC family protein [Pseudoxanthomonas wuyuanensis]SOD55438.1 Catechol 2,3-dioxygenase [Pseudoxanthomonas wuyuanensis]